MNSRITIYTDGSSLGNPGAGGWGAILFYNGKVREMGGGEKKTTNNRMELTAAIKALHVLSEEASPATVVTDSAYLINGITKWVKDWERRGWVTAKKEPVLNRDLWEKLLAVSEGRGVSWQHVYGHSGHALNERVDKIAQSFALGASFDLFIGLEAKYPLAAKQYDTLPAKRLRASSGSGKAYAYISMIGGAIETHGTWEECRRRVQGKRGARYRKVFSKEEEQKLIASWKHGTR